MFAKSAGREQFAAVVMFVIAAIVPGTAGAATFPGTTSGSFSVSSTGGAQYSIPITVPPGTAGLQPVLAINYDSQSGDGLLGLGFSLSGLSTITRCPATLEQDGFLAGITFTSSDRFCLDGQRLISIGGSEYRTEIESFTKVVASGTASDPSSFTAWTKSGLVMQFGATADSRIEGLGKSQALVWAANKITDSAGNYLTVTYYENTTTGEFAPAYIAYTGNVSGGIAPTTYVSFFYEAKPDVQTMYVGGSLTSRAARLSAIKTYVDASSPGSGTLVREYRLAYDSAAAFGKSQLSSVTECAPNSNCLPPTTFQWLSGGSPAVSLLFTSSVCANNSQAYNICDNSNNHDTLQYPDINGDGRADVCYRGDQGVACFLGTGNGLGQFISTNVQASPNSGTFSELHASILRRSPAFVDVNADGKADLVARTQSGIQAYRSTGTGFVPLFSTSICADGSTSYGVCDSRDNYETIQWPDIDGDGYPDLCYRGDQGVNCFLGTGSGLGTQIQTSFCANGSTSNGVCNDSDNHWSVKFVDMTGDGMADLVYRGDQGIRIWRSNGTGFAQLVYASTLCANGYGTNVCNDGNNYDTLKYPDINGDGLADICYRGDSGITCHLDKGVGPDGTLQLGQVIQTSICADSSGAYGGCNDRNNHYVIDYADVNGDGMADLLYRGDVGLQVWLSTSTGFTQFSSNSGVCGDGSTVFGTCNDDDNHYSLQYPDFDGDGIADVAFRADGGVAAVKIGARAGAVSKITTGLGGAVSLVYLPLTDNSIYTKGSGAAYPVMDVQLPQRVVKAAQRLESASWDTTTYSYSGARLHLRGRGFLGFAQMVATDLTKGIRETTDYQQDFPFTGLPKRVLAELASIGSDVSLVETTYNSKTFGTRRFPFAQRIIERAYEIPPYAKLVSTKITDNTYGDSFGNLTASTVKVYAGSESGGLPFQTDNVNTYDDDTANWRLGRMRTAQVTRTTPEGLTATRSSSFDYDYYTGLLSAETIEPGTAFELKTTYGRDSFGNITSTTVSGADIISRTTNQGFSSGYPYYGRFNTSTTNALNHTETREFNVANGTVSLATSPNGLQTAFQYDGFGRLIRKQFSQHGILTWTQTERLFCNQTTWCLTSDDAIVVRSYTATGTESVVVYDFNERDTRRLTKGGDGRFLEVRTEYDSAGRVHRQSSPKFTNESQIYWTTYSYDALGRPSLVEAPASESNPAGRRTTVEYDGLMVRKFDALSRQTTTESNALGKTIKVTDALNGVMRYGYDAFDNLASTIGPDSTTTIIYDRLGHKKEMTDADMGRWTYVYNVLGELTKQTDAKGQVVTMKYDKLGRMFERTEPEGLTTWTYDTLWKGALTSVTSPGYTRAVEYHPFGEVKTETVTIASATPPTGAFIESFSATPSSISQGQTVTLSWTAYDSTGCSASGTLPGWSGSKNASGTQSLQVNSAGTFQATLTCSGTSGSPASRTVGITVNATPAVQITSFSASPLTFSAGQSTTLSWSASNASTCSGSGSLPNWPGSKSLSGSQNVVVSTPGTFDAILTCTDAASRTDSETLTIATTDDPVAINQFYAQPTAIQTNSSTAINWASSNAVSCTASGNLPGWSGPRTKNGRQVIKVQNAGNYNATLTCRDAQGRTQARSTTVNVQLLCLNCGTASPNPPSDEAGIYIFNAQPAKIQIGKSTRISWYTYNAELCLAGGNLSAWSGQKDPNGSSQVITVNSTGKFNLSLTCYDRYYRSVSKSTTLEVVLLCTDCGSASAAGGVSKATVSGAGGAQAAEAAPPGTVQYVFSYTYDGFGRLRDMTYPSDIVLRHGYSVHGALETIAGAVSGTVYWRARDWDHWGKVSESERANGIISTWTRDAAVGHLDAITTGPGAVGSVQSLYYEWDVIGNLKSRADSLQGVTESFDYDELYRLKISRLNGVQNLAVTYTASGNIKTKSDVGLYEYEGPRPHAATHIDGVLYLYDANGNLTAGGSHSYTPTSFNVPASVTKGSNTESFLYGAERQRIRQTVSVSGSARRVIYYASALYEEHYRSSSYVEKKSYVATPEGVVAVFTNGPSSSRVDYLHRDHLGSVDVVTNQSGQAIEQLSYDAFGNRRDADWAGAPSTNSFFTRRGYTGHEEMDEVGLVHMNGRVYDPLLGRFSSADPIVTDPGSTQGLNRYSYVDNNPLTLVDPSGFSWWGKQVNRFGKETRRWERDFRKEIRNPDSLLGPVIQISATAGCIASVVCAPYAPAVAAATAAAVARAQGLSGNLILRQAVIAAAQAAAFNAVGDAFPVQGSVSNVIGHGVVGGVTSGVAGGDFASGFFSAAVSSAVPVPDDLVAGTVVSAAVGGTAAEISGGKFANGAVTGAYGYLFNFLAHKAAEYRSRFGYGGGGHHVVPAGSLTGEDISDEMGTVFAKTKISGIGEHDFGDGHPDYNVAVRAELKAWANAMNVDLAKATAADARAFLVHLSRTSNPTIHNFNANVVSKAMARGHTPFSRLSRGIGRGIAAGAAGMAAGSIADQMLQTQMMQRCVSEGC